jgi:3-dehydroquinate dehydratase II
MKTILVLNGPNLQRLGTREPDIYGTKSFADLVELLENQALNLGCKLDICQSDSESVLIAKLHEAIDLNQEVILNPAAFTHYSYALADACKALTSKGLRLIEVHISNPSAREDFRSHSVISSVASGVIAGFGFDSYRLALQQLAG